MAAPLPTLRKKLARRKAQRNKQARKWRRTGLAGHGKLAVAAGKAVKKLRRLIRRALKARRIDWNGYPPLTYGKIKAAARVALEVPGLYITSTTGGVHSPTSWHYKARAFDGGSNSSDEGPEKRAQQKLLDEFGAGYFAELFGPLSWHVKDGVVRSGTFPGHHDHLHVAVA